MRWLRTRRWAKRWALRIDRALHPLPPTVRTDQATAEHEVWDQMWEKR